MLHDIIQGTKIPYLAALQPPQNLSSPAWSKLSNPKEEEKSSRGYAASFEEQLPFLLHLPTLGCMTLPRWEKQSVDGQSFTQLIRMKRKKEMILGDN